MGCKKCLQVSSLQHDKEELTQALERSHASYQTLKTEHGRLLRELQASDDVNRRHMIHQLELDQEIKLLQSSNVSLEAQAKEARSKEAEADARAQALANELSEYQMLYQQKVADLDAEVSRNQVLIAQQVKTLETQEITLKELSAQV